MLQKLKVQVYSRLFRYSTEVLLYLNVLLAEMLACFPRLTLAEELRAYNKMESCFESQARKELGLICLLLWGLLMGYGCSVEGGSLEFQGACGLNGELLAGPGICIGLGGPASGLPMITF